MNETKRSGAFDSVLAELDGKHPDGEQYVRLATVVLEHPKARALATLDPFSAEYRTAALDLYATLRARKDDDLYVAERDEASESNGVVPADLWTGLVPWSFKNPKLLAEFMFAWGNILQLLNVSPGQSVLEYGPGSGQLLLMLARMGIQANGVDIDRTALDGIRRQADILGLPVNLECGRFGAGFQGERFDAILFFEAFHHALDFQELLQTLRQRLKPGGRLILCGEPIVDTVIPAIPFAWGPRMDALSVFCMRRWGWMELGFTREFLTEAARRAGWRTTHHPFPGYGRACACVLEPVEADEPAEPALPAVVQVPVIPTADNGSILSAMAIAEQLRRELTAMQQSTSWRVTGFLRDLGRLKLRLIGSSSRRS